MILKTGAMARSVWMLGVGCGLLAAACGAPERGETGLPDVRGEAAVSDSLGRIEGTPPGDLDTWLTDIERGMDSALAAMDSGWVPAQRALLELYVGRQEYLEMYWGPSGRLQGEGGAELGERIVELESAFHELLQAFVSQPLDAERLERARGAVKSRIAEVRRVAPLSGLVLRPPPPGAAAGGAGSGR